MAPAACNAPPPQPLPALLAHAHASVGEGLDFLMRLHRQQPPGDGKIDAKKHQKHGRRQQQQQPQQHQPQEQRATVAAAAAAAGLASLYFGARGALSVYGRVRRRCLRRLLCVVGPALAAAGVDYYVDFGSLLGAVREGDVIAHDNDADVVALNPDFDALLPALRAALPPAFKAYVVVPSEDASVRWLRVLYGVGVLDIYGGYYDAAAALGGSSGGAAGGGDGSRSSAAAAAEAKAVGGGSAAVRAGAAAAAATIAIPQGHGDLCDVPAALVLPLQPLQFRGVTLSGPANAHGVLVHRYGPAYMVPRYMDKGRDAVEQAKLYARALTLLGKIGVRI